jgi:hypothetical protein
MNCSLNTAAGLISAAIALLLAAIAISYLWVAAVPLFIAAGLVASVSFGLIPAIKNALVDYAQCRGASDKCSIALGINTLGQAAATLSRPVSSSSPWRMALRSCVSSCDATSSLTLDSIRAASTNHSQQRPLRPTPRFTPDG